MSIIKRKRGNVIYVCEAIYVKVKDGKRQYKEKVIGHLDEAGNFIPSKKMRGKKPEDFPAEIQKVTTITTKIRVVEKSEADCRKESNGQEKTEATVSQANAPQAEDLVNDTRPLPPETVKTEVVPQKGNPEKPATTSELGLYTSDPLAVMFNGKATGTLGKLKTVGTFNEQQKTANVNGVRIISQNISEMGVGEAKIFRYALAAFTQKNSTGTERQKLNLRMFLSFNDYAKATNTDISTEYGRKNFKKKLKKNLENLMEKHISFSWIEDVRGKNKSYGGLSLISGYKISKDAITVDFSLGFAEYLVSLPTLVEYPRALYSVNDRNYNAFAIGEAMFQHYSINNNVIKGTEQMLSVQKILEVTSFPTYEKVKEEHHSWEYKIKEQLEKSLDHLYECGLIKDWCYSYAKGKKLTDEEAKQITSYEKFASLYIWYELNAYPEHNERADMIIEAKEKSLEKLKKRKPKSKNKE